MIIDRRRFADKPFRSKVLVWSFELKLDKAETKNARAGSLPSGRFGEVR